MGLRNIVLAGVVGSVYALGHGSAQAHESVSPDYVNEAAVVLASSNASQRSDKEKDYRSYLDSVVDGKYTMTAKNPNGVATAATKLWVNAKTKDRYVIRLKGSGLTGMKDYLQESKGTISSTDLVSETLTVYVDAGIFGDHTETHTFTGKKLHYVKNPVIGDNVNVFVDKPTTGRANDLLAILVDQGFSHKNGSNPQSYTLLINGTLGSVTFSPKTRGKYNISVKSGSTELLKSGSYVTYLNSGKIDSLRFAQTNGESLVLKPRS